MGTAYKFDIIAKTGGSIKKIESRTSINDLGHVAFVGDFDITKPGNAVFVAGDSFVKEITDSQGILQFGTAVQINNSGQVVANWRKTNGVGATYLYNSNGTNDFKVIATAGGYQTGFSYPFDYYSILPINSVNNKGESVFAAFEKDFKYDLFTGARYELGDIKLITASNPIPILQSFFDEKPIFTPLIERPLIADNGNVIITEKAGQGSSSQRSLILYDNDLNVIQTIASSSNGFTQIGSSPGISDDGKAIAFYGVDNNEPGIFVWFDDITARVASISGEITGFISDSRIGISSNLVNNLLTGDKGQATITYLALDQFGKESLYTSQIRLNENLVTSEIEVSQNQTLVVKVGDTIAGLPGTIQDLEIYDPVNKTGQLAFGLLRMQERKLS